MRKTEKIRSKLINDLNHNSIYRYYSVAKHIIKNIHLIILCYFFRLLPIENDKIVFSSFNGTAYNAQPKYIFDSLETKPYKLIWLLSNKSRQQPTCCTVKPKSVRAIYELMTAGVWIDNCRKEFWIKKRKGQLYIQTWHGPVCLKAIEKDAEDSLPQVYIKSAINDSKNADYVVSETEWRTKNIINSFWYNGNIIKGEFKKEIDFEKSCADVKDFFRISNDVKILLYAPTFRKDGSTRNYIKDFGMIIKALEEKTKKSWKVIVRLHPNIKNNQSSIEYSEMVLNGTLYPTIDDLIAASDLIISDYSGVIFEGYRVEKKVILYTSDLYEYVLCDRKMYFDLEQLPSSLSKNLSELISNIYHFDDESYETKRKNFIKKIGYYNDNATLICRNIIINHINGKGA